MANHDLSFAAVGGPLTAMVVSRDPPGITPMKVLPSPELRAALASQRGGIRRVRSLLGTLGLGGSEEVLGFHPHIAERPHDTADLAGTDRGGHLGLQVAQGCLERPALGAQRAVSALPQRSQLGVHLAQVRPEAGDRLLTWLVAQQLVHRHVQRGDIPADSGIRGEGSGIRPRPKCMNAPGPHVPSRLACQRAFLARTPARSFSLAGERRARSPVGSAVIAGPFLLTFGSTCRWPGFRFRLSARAASSRSWRSFAAAWRARTATRRLARASALSKTSAFRAARAFSAAAWPRAPCSATRALAARRY